MIRRFNIFLNESPKVFTLVLGSDDDVQSIGLAMSSSVAVRNLSAAATYEDDLYTDDSEVLTTDEYEALIADVSISTV